MANTTKQSYLEEVQNTYEQRFNCILCFCPSLRMIYGSCQHRICEECLYNEDDIRRPSLDRCPTCQKVEAFPIIRPVNPEDNIELMRCLGVRECTNAGCKNEVWEWELESHVRTCPNRILTPKSVSRRRTVLDSDSDMKAARARRKESLRHSSSNSLLSRLRSFRRSTRSSNS